MVELNRQKAERALKCVKTTNVQLDKIADHFGYKGKQREKFIKVASELRTALWTKLSSMTEEEKIKWTRKQR